MSNIPAHPENVPFELLPLSGMRKVIGQRMVQSVREAPHFYVASTVEMTGVVALRQRLKARGENVSFNDIILKATALTLRERPRMNCSFTPEGIKLFQEINVGFVAAVPDGLVVPVIRQADQKSLIEINPEVRELAELARAGKLIARATVGGTFTVSNLGMFGSDAVLPIINPPQAGILGVGAIKDAPIVVDSKIEVRPVCEFWLGCDHRAVDGVIGAEFLGAFKQIIQEPERLDS